MAGLTRRLFFRRSAEAVATVAAAAVLPTKAASLPLTPMETVARAGVLLPTRWTSGPTVVCSTVVSEAYAQTQMCSTGYSIYSAKHPFVDTTETHFEDDEW